MKNKIYSLLLIAFLCIFTVGCSSEEKENSKLFAEQFLTKYQQHDPTISEMIYGETAQSFDFQGAQAALAEKITFEISEVKKDGDIYLVSTQITSVDFGAALDYLISSFSRNDSENVINERILNYLESDEAITKTFDVDIYVQTENENYKIVMTSELADALSGGYYAYINGIVEDMING